MVEIPRRKLLGMTMAVFGFFATLSEVLLRPFYDQISFGLSPFNG
jgi:hypothetical protein